MGCVEFGYRTGYGNLTLERWLGDLNPLAKYHIITTSIINILLFESITDTF